MAIAHKIVYSCLRVFELGCSAIVLGLLAKFFRLLNMFGGTSDSRLLYSISMAAISVFASIVLVTPLKYSFYCFPLDLALFVCWIVCFALLEDLTGTNTCSSPWYDDYWTIYWATPDTVDAAIISTSGCSKWRAILSFSFIGAWGWFFSALIGIYACVTYYGLGTRVAAISKRAMWWKKPKERDLEKDEPVNSETQHLPLVGQANP